MYKKHIFFITLILLSSMILQINIKAFAVNESIEIKKNQSVAMLYDATNYYGDDRNAIEAIKNLISHFDYSSEKINITEEYKDISNYEYLFVFISNQDNIDQKWMNNIRAFQGKIMWIGEGINKINQKIVDNGRVNNLVRVIYKDEVYDIGVKRYFRKIDANEDSIIYSELFDGKKYYPFIVQNGHIWYTSRLDLNEPLFYIFADVLFEFFEKQPDAHEGVYFKIQDIHPFTNPQSLKNTIDVFLDRGIPFAMSIIPIYKEEGASFQTPLREKKELIKLIEYGIENGASLILQGSHQIFAADEIVGEDYFEWQKKNDGSVEDWIDEILKESMSEMAYNKLYPVAFDPKHFNFSRSAYARISKYFDTAIGWIQDRDWLNKYTIYPFEIKSSHGFKTYIPENLTYEYSNGPYELQDLKKRLDKVTITRQFLGGISITPDIDENTLDKTIDYILSENIPCLSLKQFDSSVESEIYTVELLNGESVISIGDIVQEGEENMLILAMFYIILLALVFVVILFGFTYFKSRNQTKNKLF